MLKLTARIERERAEIPANEWRDATKNQDLVPPEGEIVGVISEEIAQLMALFFRYQAELAEAERLFYKTKKFENRALWRKRGEKYARLKKFCLFLDHFVWEAIIEELPEEKRVGIFGLFEMRTEPMYAFFVGRGGEIVRRLLTQKERKEMEAATAAEEPMVSWGHNPKKAKPPQH